MNLMIFRIFNQTIGLKTRKNRFKKDLLNWTNQPTRT